MIEKVLKRIGFKDVVDSYEAKKSHIRWTAKDQEMLNFYQQFVSADDLCFDIGANVGNRVKILLKLNAKVVAVEPQLECLTIMEAVYRDNSNLILVQKAIGEAEGEAEIFIGSANTLSSLSKEWMEAVRRSGRFSAYHWRAKRRVSVTTLDSLIDRYGVPTFIKIDVEGYEYHVIKGLSRPVKMLSLEFVPEFIQSTFNCLEHLQRLGDIRLNYYLGESMRFVLEKWIPTTEMIEILAGFQGENRTFGDIYIRFST